jgi:hypothetical protein
MGSDPDPIDDIELDPQARAHIDAVYGVLASADHYELLGLERGASKNDIKAAYYRVGPAFHPDRHFRKSLGRYKRKIEAIFGALTRAHDTLRYGKRREAYDSAYPARSGSARRRQLMQAAIEYLGRNERLSQPEPDPAGRVSGLTTPPGDLRSSNYPTEPVPGSPSPYPSTLPAPPSARPPMQSSPGSDPGFISDVPDDECDAVLPPAPGESSPAGRLSDGLAGPIDGGYRRTIPPSARPPPHPAVARRDAASMRPAARVGASAPPGATPDRGRTSRPPPGSAPPMRPRLRSYPDDSPPAEASEPQRVSGSSFGAAVPRNEEAMRLQREALARKLSARGGVVPVPPPPAPVGEIRSRKRPEGTYRNPESVERSAAEVVRDRLASVADDVRKRRLERYLEQGRVAAAARDFRAATAAYEQASRLAPDDPEIAAKLKEVSELVIGGR